MAIEKDWGQDNSCANCGDQYFEPSKVSSICAQCYDDPMMLNGIPSYESTNESNWFESS